MAQINSTIMSYINYSQDKLGDFADLKHPTLSTEVFFCHFWSQKAIIPDSYYRK